VDSSNGGEFEIWHIAHLERVDPLRHMLFVDSRRSKTHRLAASHYFFVDFGSPQGSVAAAKTFFVNNGQTGGGVILGQCFTLNTPAQKMIIVAHELSRVCHGHLRHPPPADQLLAGGCAAALKLLHKQINKAIDAAQDATNRARGSTIQPPPGMNADNEIGDYCGAARQAYNHAVWLKQNIKKLTPFLKGGMDLAAPPAQPTPAEQYIMDGYRRVCRANTIARRALAAANK